VTYAAMFFHNDACVCHNNIVLCLAVLQRKDLTLKPKLVQFNATDAVIIILHTEVPIIVVAPREINRRESTV